MKYVATTYSFNANSLALGTVEIVRASGQLLEVNVLAHIHLAAVDLHDASASLLIWMWELNFTIETT